MIGTPGPLSLPLASVAWLGLRARCVCPAWPAISETALGVEGPGEGAEDVIVQRKRSRVLPQKGNRIAIVVRHRHETDVARSRAIELLLR